MVTIYDKKGGVGRGKHILAECQWQCRTFHLSRTQPRQVSTIKLVLYRLSREVTYLKVAWKSQRNEAQQSVSDIICSEVQVKLHNVIHTIVCHKVLHTNRLRLWCQMHNILISICWWLSHPCPSGTSSWLLRLVQCAPSNHRGSCR